MNLRTRITAFVVAASAIGTLLLGGAALAWLRTSQVGAIDDNLRAIAVQVRGNAQDPVSEATFAVDGSGIPVALGFIASGTGLSWLRTGPTVEPEPPRSELVTASLDEPVTTPDGFRLYSLRLANGERLLFASSLAAVDEENARGRLRLLLLWLPFNAALAWVVTRFVNRDVRQLERLVAVASDIAAGVDDVAVPQAGRSSETRTLAMALDQLVRSLRHALATERSANERMQQFLGDASHELRTPLTVVKGYLELLERPDGLDAEQRTRAIDRMHQEAERMEVLVNDLLLLAEIGSTQAQDLGSVDLTGLVRVLVEDFRVLQPQRPVTTSIEAGITVDGIASHLHRAIANALANVRRHTPADAPLRVDLRTTPQGVLLTVEDGGPGLPDDRYANGIGHFQRFDRARSRVTGGSGLGMSIMAAVVRELGGSIDLRRSELGGLALDFVLPTSRN